MSSCREVIPISNVLRLSPAVQSLMSSCREVILQHMAGSAISQLPLPPALKNFIAFKS